MLKAHEWRVAYDVVRAVHNGVPTRRSSTEGDLVGAMAVVTPSTRVLARWHRSRDTARLRRPFIAFLSDRCMALPTSGALEVELIARTVRYFLKEALSLNDARAGQSPLPAQDERIVCWAASALSMRWSEVLQIPPRWRHAAILAVVPLLKVGRSHDQAVLLALKATIAFQDRLLEGGEGVLFEELATQGALAIAHNEDSHVAVSVGLIRRQLSVER